MSKAYDRVEWRFLKAVMLKLNFSLNWVNLIMRFITSVSYSFKIYQSGVGDLKPQRGLRQGDILSPYLFALCAQGLSALLAKAAERRLFRGVKSATGSLIISHIFFADDSLIFFRATLQDCILVKNCLQLYESASGQMVNFDKLALTFCPSSSTIVIDEIKKSIMYSSGEGSQALSRPSNFLPQK